MNKKDLTERDICTQFITPTLMGARWDFQSHDARFPQGDPEELLAKFDEAEKKAAALRDQLKTALERALLR